MSLHQEENLREEAKFQEMEEAIQELPRKEGEAGQAGISEHILPVARAVEFSKLDGRI